MADDDYYIGFWAGFRAGMFDMGDDGVRDGATVEKKKAQARKLAQADAGLLEPESKADVMSAHQNTRAWKSGFNRGTEFQLLYAEGFFGDLEQRLEGLRGGAAAAHDLGQAAAGFVNDPVGSMWQLGIQGASALGSGVLDAVGMDDTGDELEDLLGG